MRRTDKKDKKHKKASRYETPYMTPAELQQYHYNKAMVELENGSFDTTLNALRQLNAAIKNIKKTDEPTTLHQKCYLERSKIHEKLGDTKSSGLDQEKAESINKSLKSNPKDTPSWGSYIKSKSKNNKEFSLEL